MGNCVGPQSDGKQSDGFDGSRVEAKDTSQNVTEAYSFWYVAVVLARAHAQGLSLAVLQGQKQDLQADEGHIG